MLDHKWGVPLFFGLCYRKWRTDSLTEQLLMGWSKAQDLRSSNKSNSPIVIVMTKRLVHKPCFAQLNGEQYTV